MHINKKYILSILFLFSSASALPISCSDISIEKLYIAKIDITFGQVVGILITIGCIKLAAWLTDQLFSQAIFMRTYDDNARKYRFDKKTTEFYIQKFPNIIRLILKLHLFINHRSTQESYVSYIKSICYAKQYQEMQSIVRFLLDSGINPRFSWSWSQSLLTTACLNQDSQELAKYLIETLKLDPNDRDRQTKYKSVGYAHYGPCIEDASDPLSAACYTNNTQIVKLLIKHNTHTHPFLDLDPMHTPPILRAIQNNNTEMFKDLFLYTVKTDQTLIHKIWQLKQIMEDKDLRKIIANNFINLSIIKADDLLLDNCFTCDEKIWLPHNHNMYSGHHDLYSGRIKTPQRMDKNAAITNAESRRTRDIKKAHKKMILEFKEKIIEFLPRLQISS
jgi:hypothetical protein